MLDVAKTHPFLKGLAQTRARAAGDVERYAALGASLDARLAKALAQALAQALAKTKVIVKRAEALASAFSAKRTKAQAEVDACDLFLRKLAPSADPSRIPSIRSQDTYDHRGSLSEAIAEYLRARAPAETSTKEVAKAVQDMLGIEFPTAACRARWIRCSVAPQLRVFVYRGVVERLHEPQFRRANPGRWRWKRQGATTLDDLRAQAAAAGIGTVQATDMPLPWDEEGV